MYFDLIEWEGIAAADGLIKKGEILLYDSGKDKEYISVIFRDEIFWLAQKAMAELFGCRTGNISLHLKNIFAEGELDRDAVAELISERATPDSPAMGLTTRKGAPDRKILKSDTLAAKNYLNEKDLSRLNRLATVCIDCAELMAGDEQLMSMQDRPDETDRLLTNSRRQVLGCKGHLSRDAAAKKVGAICGEFREKQDAEYISEFDREAANYLKGGESH